MQSNELKIHTVEEIYQAAREHSFYRDVLKETKCFADVPILEKQILYRQVEANLKEASFRTGLYLSPTGGSSSSQVLFFPTDVTENRFQRALLSKYLIHSEIFTPSTMALNLFGGTMMYRSLEIFNDFCERARATTLPVSSLCPDREAYETAIRFGANTLMGIPSRLMQFARYVIKQKLQVRIEHIIFAGEPLLYHQREYLQKAFHATRFSGLYGSAEAGVWAYQPPDLPSEGYLFPSQLMHVEINNPNEEGFGTIIATNLIRSRNPLLRYDTGDIGRLSKIMYRGSRFNMLELKGRVDCSFSIGGSYYFLDDFASIFERLADFQIQISYDPEKARDRIQFCCVPMTPTYSTYQFNELCSKIQEILRSNDNSFLTEVRIAEHEELLKSATSQKVIKIVDRRNEQSKITPLTGGLGRSGRKGTGVIYSLDINLLRSNSLDINLLRK
ncbi:hypothetical protein NDI39_15915 [Microcoleus sp. ZQ-A2]|nr:hypothetical protein [Microcoleus sp. FACHB-1]